MVRAAWAEAVGGGNMSLLTLIVTLVVVGVIMWLINAYIPMEPGIKRILNIAVLIIVVLWLLTSMGLLGNFEMIRVGK
jgi:hypothetical protein